MNAFEHEIEIENEQKRENIRDGNHSTAFSNFENDLENFPFKEVSEFVRKKPAM